MVDDPARGKRLSELERQKVAVREGDICSVTGNAAIWQVAADAELIEYQGASMKAAGKCCNAAIQKFGAK